MASIKFLLGWVPKTAQYEQQTDNLTKEYQAFLDYGASEEWLHYLALDQEVHSREFAEKRRQIEKAAFSDTHEYTLEKEYNSLAADREIKTYFKIAGSPALQKYNQAAQSAELARYTELTETVASAGFLKVKQYMALSPAKKWAASDEFRTWNDYLRQKSDKSVKNYKAVASNKLLPLYQKALDNGLPGHVQNLRDYLHSAAYKTTVKALKKGKDGAIWKGSEEEKLAGEYQQLVKSAEYKAYQKLSKLSALNDYNRLKASPELEAFTELEKFCLSESFKARRREIEGQKFENTPEFKTESEFLTLKKHPLVVHFFKFGKSADYHTYEKISESARLARYNELKELLDGEDFKKVKTYMALPARKKFEQSAEYQRLQEYETLHKSEKVKWYLALKAKNSFNEITKRKLTFEDDFDSPALDRNKWMTRYFWGEALLNDGYALAHEKHYFTDGQNIEQRNSMARITTRKEHIKGRIWHPVVGFYPAEFEYSSGLLSTGKSFRQQYGRFEAKIKFGSRANPVNHAFWMLSEAMLPHLDIAKAASRVTTGSFWPQGTEGQVGKHVDAIPARYADDFQIYTLDWYPDRLEWKLNGVLITRQTVNVPQKPMYINLSSALYSEAGSNDLPVTMEIDWVRCYQWV